MPLVGMLKISYISRTVRSRESGKLNEYLVSIRRPFRLVEMEILLYTEFVLK